MRRGPVNRWRQLLLCVVCMAMVANLQYGWALFVTPLDAAFGWGRAAIQDAFTIFVAAGTWLMPVAGYVADRRGPRSVTLAGGALVALAWALNAAAQALPTLYVAAALGGIGAGAVYAACIGAALKWFPDQRGLAAGITAAGFGTASALTLLPVQALINSSGHAAAFLYFGVGQGLIVCLAALALAAPPPATLDAAARDYRPLETLRTPVFWLLYLMFAAVVTGGVLAAAQLAPIAKDFGIANAPVSILGLALPALAFALIVDRVFSGLSRPCFGWLSDRIGRENAMCTAFATAAVCMIALAHFGRDPLAFVALAALMFFAWGEIYSLFPATCADAFGGRFAAANAGLLHTAKGVAALLLPAWIALAETTGSWHAAFYAAAGLHAVVALAAVVFLTPLRARQLAADRAPLPPP